MAVVKNLMVRVGADLSGLVTGFSRGARATNTFKKQTEAAMKDSAASLGNLKKAMVSSNNNTAIIALTDKIKELEDGLRAAGQAGFSWGFESFESDVLQLRDLKTQLNEYVEGFNKKPDGPKEWVSQLREIQSIQSQLEGGGSVGGQAVDTQSMQNLNEQLDKFVSGLQKSVDSAQPLGAQLIAAKNALKEMERAGLGVGDAVWDDMYLTVASLTEQVSKYKEELKAPSVEPIDADELAVNLRTAVDNAQSLGEKLETAKLSLRALEDTGLRVGDAAWDDMYITVSSLTQEVKDYKAELDGVGEETEDATRETGKFGAAVKSAFSRLSGLGKTSHSTSGGIESLVRSIRRIGLVSVGLQLTKAVFGELQSIVSQYVSQNTVLQAQVTALKSSLGQALAPAINLVTNALSVMMPYVVGVSNAIGSLITNLFGTGWTSVADGANAAAAAIGGAGSAQKEFNRTLAGFDEVTKLGSENSGGGGGGSSTTTATEGKTPAWLTSLSTQIQQAAAEGDFFGVGAAIANAVNTGINSINISDTSLGSKIATLINDGVEAAAGFVETLDWSGIGTAIKTNVSDLFSGIDWTSMGSTIGAAMGGIGTAIWAAIGDGVAFLGDYFQPWIEKSEQIGGNVLTGILTGIVAGIADIGNWIGENILSPFVQGFKSVFKIHSPSTHKDITSLGENIIGGIFNGITDALSDPVGWIKENVFAPLTDGFNKVFGEDGFFANLFSGGESGNVSVSVDVEAKLTTWKDKLKSKVVDFQSKLTTWKDNLKNKSIAFQSKLTTWQDSLRNKVVDFQSRLTTWRDSLSNKVVTFQSNLTTWKDSLKDKVVNFQSNLTTWKDSLKDKSVKFQSNLTSWKDSLSGKAVMFQANLTSWIDSLQNKWLEFKASVKQGWWGSLADALGISEIWASLKLKLPKVSVTWATAELGGVSIPYPSFSIKWNAKGGIMDGAQIFGRVGNTLLGGGEAGREAILPLDRNTWWMDKIADRVALRVNVGQSGAQDITINLVLDGKVITSTVVRNINAQARATGRNPLAAYI